MVGHELGDLRREMYDQVEPFLFQSGRDPVSPVRELRRAERPVEQQLDEIETGIAGERDLFVQ
ncbi:hypothetical protein BRC64_07045 [Halobacteriales archaeon QH_10_67_22]|nr:MAG: hypothetical protein BRC64_07045 [Halobacteriales archaeon QH_10_67_22]